MKELLAFDLGGSSGRAIRGAYDGETLTCTEVHRFENRPRQAAGYFRWDFADLMANVRQGLACAGRVDGIGFDTWGVDFGLLDAAGQLLEDPVHYRDSRTDGLVEQALKQLPAHRLYAATGNQILPINTLFQLLALQRQQPELWARTARILFLPDLFLYTLCGAQVCERSIASTSQMLDPRTGRWSADVLDTFGIPETRFAPLVPSGTVAGQWRGIPVIAVAGHDTQCAVAAMPEAEEGAAFLSCGTWSLLGCTLDAPLLGEESRRLAFSNEQGADGRTHYLKNLIGLWLVQESRRQWQREGQHYSYGELEQRAAAAAPLRSFIDPNAPEFTPPGDLPGRVRAFCRRTGQPVPETPGEVVRCLYESLALQYRLTLEQLTRATGRTFTVLHILGGGAQAGLLCQMTADCTGLPVTAGPVEATALGNLLLQLVALGELRDLEQGRALIRRTQSVRHYLPQSSGPWEEAYARFQDCVHL